MDSTDLLAREEEFRKLNKQLEIKTVSLMKQIETAMQKQDIFSDFSPSLSLKNVQTARAHCCDSSKSNTPDQTPTKNRKPKKSAEPKNQEPKQSDQRKAEQRKISDLEQENSENGPSKTNCILCCSKTVHKNENLEFLYAFVSLNIQANVLPQSFLKDNNVNVESICKFLASKVTLMQEQIDKLQSTLNKKASQCENHLTQIAEFECERLKLMNKANSLTAESEHMKAKASVLRNRLNEAERLYKEQRSASDRVTSEIQRLKTRNAALEARSIGQDEDIDKLKANVHALKIAEKDFRDSTRSLSASHTSAISRLEAKVKSLSMTIDKQRALIDNLKQQNSILSVETAVKALEKEYMDFLLK